MIDIDALDLPQVIEPLDYEGVKSDMVRDLSLRWPEWSAILESDPAMKLIEVFAYREILLRARINAAAKACFLATATGTNLDNIAANFNVARKAGEDDAALRKRVLLRFEAMSTAGARNAYIYWAMTVDEVADCSITSPTPGLVHVHILARNDDTTAEFDSNLRDKVFSVLSAEDVRPLTDTVEVYTAERVKFSVNITCTVNATLLADEVLTAAKASVQAYIDAKRLVGAAISYSAICAAAMIEGVKDVDVELIPASTGKPQTANIVCNAAQAPLCTVVNAKYSLGDVGDLPCEH